MNNFGYSRASDVADAVRQVAADPAAVFIAMTPFNAATARLGNSAPPRA